MGNDLTFDIADGGCDPQPLEEVVGLLVDHQEVHLLPSSDESHHL